MNHDRGHALVGDLNRRSLAILDACIDRRGIECVSVFRLALNDGIPATLCVGDADDAVAVGGIGPEDFTIDFTNLELDTTEPLSGVLIGLDDLQAASRDVIHDQSLKIVGVNNDGLASCGFIDGVARDRFHFRHNKCADNISDEDLTICVSHIKAVGRELTTLICHKAAVAIGDAELNPFQRLLRDAIKLNDSKPTERLVAKFQRNHLVGFDLDRLRSIIQQIAILGARFFDDKRRARGNVGNGEGTSTIGNELAIGIPNEIAVRIGHEELNIRDWFIRCGVHLFHQNATLRLVAELHRDDFVGFDLDRLRSIVEDIAIFCTSLLDDECGVGSNIRNGKSTCAVRHIFAVGITDEVSIRVSHKELDIGDWFVRCSIDLSD